MWQALQGVACVPQSPSPKNRGRKHITDVPCLLQKDVGDSCMTAMQGVR